MADCPDFYSISPSQVDAVGESLWGSYYTNPSLEMADTEIEEYMNKTFPKLDDPPTSDPHQPLPCTSNTTDEADGKSSATDNPPSSNYQPPPCASAAVNQKESEKDPGDFLDHLTEMEYDLLTAEPAVSPSEVTEDVPPAKIKRFGAVPSSEELVALSRFEVPRNTARSTQWAVKVFSSWAEENNKENEVQCPTDLLERVTDPEKLGRWLSKFLVSARNRQGNNYTPQSVHCILSGLLRHIRARNPAAASLNFLDTNNSAFQPFQAVLDRCFRQLSVTGKSTSVSTPVIAVEDEEKFWETGALGTETPEKLLHTVFYLNGKNFLLRGGEEHYNLKISQMQRFENPPRYEYTELVSKNRAGGLASYRLKNKVVPVFQDESLGKQCHVYVLDLYLSKIPSSARAQDVFYLRPKPVNMEDDNPWYSSQRIGRNRISQLMKTICSGSGVQNKYTNHSLRATGATRLFQSGTPENVIMERSGHRSTDGVRQYERVSQYQHIAAQAILTARDGFRAYDAELQSVQKRKKAIKESPTKSARKPLTENMSQHPLSQTENATVLPDTQKESKLLSLIPVMDDGKKLVHLHFSNCTFHF